MANIRDLKINAIPYNRLGDRFIAWKKFVARHRRLPSKHKMLWNDVLYRLKTSDAILDPLRVFVSDKEHVKDYVRAIVGDHYNVPTIAVIRDAAALHDFAFPDECCIKPTQSSGQVILRKNAAPIDIDRIAGWFNLNQYYAGREINYRYLGIGGMTPMQKLKAA
ncbi:ATP-grasp fold amidoligase family protein [Yoonia sp. BS5-3]|uniref:ATP-grasp fold amidoligase family protein n=1 Tax=Yoonia phaeophyticola TaxID=3137369 RepID=A0ABZ2V628_9RHOB